MLIRMRMIVAGITIRIIIRVIMMVLTDRVLMPWTVVYYNPSCH